MNKVSSIAGIWIGLQLLSGAVSAQTAPVEEGCRYQLARIVSEVAARLKKTLQVDPRVHGCVDERIDVAKMSYGDLQALLALYGFVDTMELDGVIQIIPDALARQQPLRLVDDRSREVGAYEMVMKVIDVAPLNAAQLVPLLRPMLSQYSHLVADTQTNSLILVARYSNIRALETLLRVLRSRPLLPMAKEGQARGEAPTQ